MNYKHGNYAGIHTHVKYATTYKVGEIETSDFGEARRKARRIADTTGNPVPITATKKGERGVRLVGKVHPTGEVLGRFGL